MMPMLRISERAVVRGIADFHDSFGLRRAGPYEPLPPSSKARGGREFNRPTFSGSRPRNPARMPFDGSPGTESGIEGRRRAATYDSNTPLISRALEARAETWSTGFSVRRAF